MILHHDNRNVFQIYAELKRLPFAVSRWNWHDDDLVVVVGVEPKGKYGRAFGFPVRDGVPNEHWAHRGKWGSLEMPNAGSYQWRIIDVPDFRLVELCREFDAGLGKKYGFEPVAPQFTPSTPPDADAKSG